MYADFNENPFARGVKAMAAGAFRGAVKSAKRAIVRAAPATVSSQVSVETAAPASTATAPVEPRDIRPLGGGMGKWIWIGGAALLALGAVMFLTRKKGKSKRRRR